MATTTLLARTQHNLHRAKKEIIHNWKSGVSVALVSIPLSLSLSIASGAGPIPGIVTAIWAGLIASIFGGSRFNVVGPAGALSTMLAAYALYFGTPQVLPVIAIISGIFILFAWAFRFDRYLVFVPQSVVHGFTLGVAITIALGQLNALLGLRGLTRHPELLANLAETSKHIGQTSLPTVGVFIFGLALMFYLFKLSPKIPNSIIVAVLGIIIGYAASANALPFALVTLKDIYGSLSLSLFNPITIAPSFYDPAIVKAGAIVAFVIILETLISAKVADGMTKTKFKRRKEVLGVGLANIAAGVTGGLPASGVFARTALNIRSGATSTWSQGINAVVVAVLSLICIGWFSYMPMAIVASILIYACVRMVGIQHFVKLYKFERSAFWLSIFVAVIMLVFDATVGILVGALVALLMCANKLSCAQAAVTTHDAHAGMDPQGSGVEQDRRGTAMVYRFAGELTYLNSANHVDEVQKIGPEITSIILNFKNLFYVDADGMEALDEIIEYAELRKLEVYVTGVHNVVLPMLNTSTWFRHMEKDGRVLASSHEAIKKALVHLNDLKS